VWMSVMFLLLFPLSRSARYLLSRHWNVAMWLHVGVGLGYFFVRARAHHVSATHALALGRTWLTVELALAGLAAPQIAPARVDLQRSVRVRVPG
jgi:hypothetical protein